MIALLQRADQGAWDHGVVALRLSSSAYRARVYHKATELELHGVEHPGWGDVNPRKPSSSPRKTMDQMPAFSRQLPQERRDPGLRDAEEPWRGGAATKLECIPSKGLPESD